MSAICSNKYCHKKIGRLENFQIRAALRAIRNAERKFDVDLHSKEYEGLCKACLLVKAQTRMTNLEIELQLEAEKAGQTVADYGKAKVKELMKYVESQTLKEGKKVNRRGY